MHQEEQDSVHYIFLSDVVDRAISYMGYIYLYVVSQLMDCLTTTSRQSCALQSAYR